MSWLKDFTTYHGRLRRSQFLWRHFVLCFVATISAMLIMGVVAVVREEEPGSAAAFAVISAILIPALYADMSLVVRRFHDVGLSGWWVLLAVLPAAAFLILPLGSTPGTIFLLAPVNLGFFAVLLVVPGSSGENRYGPPNERLD